ncbi:YveK family protein [Robertmurraya mangrovi]|nr:Wzz/FepE/Etk N-terminal domain-containing protein [Bacillus sp. 31A1R]
MDDILNIKTIFNILLKRWKLILLLILFTATTSGSITFFLIKPIYQASTQILVNQKDSERLDVTQLRGNIDLINTYSVIIKSPAILDVVIKELELPYNADYLNRNIMINSHENSQVFSITVQDTNPGRAVVIANSVSETFQKEIKGIMNVDNVSILAKAVLKEEPIPVKPKPLMNIAMAAFVGLMLGIVISYLLEFLDNTLKDGQDVEAYLELPVLGSIQRLPKQKDINIHSIPNMGDETLGV